jgi:hypothetical protein
MRPVYYALVALGLLSVSYLAGSPAEEPLYVYLYAKVSDHVNMEMSEDRLRHILPMVQKYRRAHPEAHVSTTVLFSGAVSKALQMRNPQTHIVDFVKDYLHRGVIEAGYDGTDEPTYEHRPMLEFTDEQTPEDRWRLRQEVASRTLTEARDPLTGAAAPGDGGLKEMQEVFGTAACVKGLALALKTERPHGRVFTKGDRPGPIPGGVLPIPGVYTEVGGDTEALQAMRQLNSSAIMFGVPAVNPAQLAGFREAVAGFGDTIAPEPETAPEVFWQDGVLRVSEASRTIHAVRASDGVTPLKAMLDHADRSKIHVLQIELGAVESYLKPEFAKTAANAPLKYAYDHPQSPELPHDDLAPAADVRSSWEREDEVLQWLSGVYFQANVGSRMVSSADLKSMAGASSGFTISTAALRSRLAEYLRRWGNDTFLPTHLQVESHYLSVAQLFQVLTDELAELHRTGKLPATVKAVEVHGPLYLLPGHGPNTGEVKVADLAAFCADIAGPLHDDSSRDIPKDLIPVVLKVGGENLNPAQVLRLMAKALVNPDSEAVIPIRMTYMLDVAGGVFPKSRPMGDVGFIWALKPAPLKPPAGTK